MITSLWLNYSNRYETRAWSKENQILPYRYNYRFLKQSWLERKMTKIRRKLQERAWRDEKIAKYGISMHGIRENGQLKWL